MHELSLAQAMVEEVEKVLIKEGATKVISLTITIGALSGVEKEALDFAFPVVAEGTPLEDAVLLFDEVPAKVKCRDCHQLSGSDRYFLQCEHCESINVEIVSGREFMIKSMEIET